MTVKLINSGDNCWLLCCWKDGDEELEQVYGLAMEIPLRWLLRTRLESLLFNLSFYALRSTEYCFLHTMHSGLWKSANTLLDEELGPVEMAHTSELQNEKFRAGDGEASSC